MKPAWSILWLAFLVAGCQSGISGHWHYPSPDRFLNAEHGFYYCNVLVNTYSPDLYGEVNQKNVRIYVFRYRATPEGEREKPAEQIYLKQFDLLTGPLSPEATWNPAGTLTVTLTEQNSGQIRSRTVIDLHNLE